MALTVSFAGIDWLMSLDPAWTSSIWGLIVATGALLTAFAFTTLVVTLRANRPPFDEVSSPALFNSLGSFMLAFLMLWAYMSISQVVLFYAGNLPDETIWYLRRTAGGWTLTALAVAVLGFIIPFSLLIMRPLKRNPRILAAVCASYCYRRLPATGTGSWNRLSTTTRSPRSSRSCSGPVIGGLWLGVSSWQFGKAAQYRRWSRS